MADDVDVYLEVADSRTFASAIAWPGWARSGRSAEEALETLSRYRDRYATALRAIGIRPPPEQPTLRVADRVAGGSGTEYGVASVAAPTDDDPVASDELDRQLRFLRAGWTAFDAAVAAAGDRELRKGPRGGGRDVAKMSIHVIEAEEAYIGAIGAKAPTRLPDPTAALEAVHAAAEEALRAKVRGDLADVGARGGRRWSARYFVRRAAWHALDHAWEIEDRAAG